MYFFLSVINLKYFLMYLLINLILLAFINNKNYKVFNIFYAIYSFKIIIYINDNIRGELFGKFKINRDCNNCFRFCFKLDVAVVVFAAIATGLVSGMTFVQIFRSNGKKFYRYKTYSIFLLSFPVIVILERYGLKERSSELILKLKNTTAGKLLYLYAVIRTIAAALSIRLGDMHNLFVL